MAKILFVGDSPTVSTGFSKCTRELCNRLHAAGHEVHVLGIIYHGDPHNLPYAIYPAINPLERTFMPWGEQRLPKLLARINPDVLIILQDAWNIDGYFKEVDRQLAADFKMPATVGWVSIDTFNHPYASQLNRLDHVVTWTEFGLNELRKGGYEGPASIIGLGVDTRIFHPLDRKETRAKLLPSQLQDAFIVGVVGRNQYRKHFDLALHYFASWVKSYDIPDAWLLIHTSETREMGCDIKALAKYYDIHVMLSETTVDSNVTEADMVRLYNTFDVHWSVSQSEGWNLPALEAMACGVPCILPNQGGPGEWAQFAAYLAPCTLDAINAPVNQAAFTIGSMPDKFEMIVALDKLYRSAELRADYAKLGLQLAKSLTWDRTGEQFNSLIKSIVSPSMTDLMVSPESISAYLDSEAGIEIAAD